MLFGANTSGSTSMGSGTGNRKTARPGSRMLRVEAVILRFEPVSAGDEVLSRDT